MLVRVELYLELDDLYFITVPDRYRNFKIMNYGIAGTYIVETDSSDLNCWKMKIEDGVYEILGFVKDVLIDDIETYHNFVLRRLEL